MEWLKKFSAVMLLLWASLTLAGPSATRNVPGDKITRSSGVVLSLPSTTDTLVGKATTDVLTNKTLTGNIAANFSNSGTVSLPAATDTLVGKATTDVLTNKTLTGNVAASFSNSGTISLPTGTDTLVGKATTDVLTNKTLTGNVAASFSNSGTVTLPATTDTLVGKATTDVLTNKTFDAEGTGNVLSNVKDSNIKAAAAIARTKIANGTISHVVINDGSGTLSSEANLAKTRGGTGTDITTNPITLPEISTPSTPSSGFGSVYFKSDRSLYQINSTGAETKVGSGSGGATNYILNPDAEGGLTGWASYADAAGNSPVDGTGGTATGLTFAQTASSSLHGAQKFCMTQANSTSLQGKGVSYDFTIDGADQTKRLGISVDYNASSTFVASDGATIPLFDGTVTTNAGNSDIEWFVYDKTNAVLAPVIPATMTAKGSNNYTFNGTFVAANNSTSYRLIAHVATASANATGWVFCYDNVTVGTSIRATGPSITDWIAYTPTFTGFGTVTSIGAYSRRVGDTLEFQMKFTTGTTTATTGLITLGYNGINGNVTIDTNKVGTTGIIAHGALGGAAATFFMPTGLAAGANTTFSLGVQTSTLGGANVANANNIGTTTLATFKGSVPIAGWSSNSQTASESDTKPVTSRYSSAVAQTISTATIVDFATKTYDETSSVTTGASWKFTASVSGKYKVGCRFLTATTAQAQRFQLDLYKNGSIYSTLCSHTKETTNSTRQDASGSDEISLVAGDFIDLRGTASGASTNLSGDSVFNYISIERLPSAGNITASDPVAARYFASSTSLTGSLATLVWTTKDYDDHSGMSSGVYTIPISGKYLTVCALLVNATFAAGNSDVLEIQKNSSVITRSTVNAGGIQGSVKLMASDILSFISGDTVRCQASSAGTSPSIASSNFDNYFSIVRVGN